MTAPITFAPLFSHHAVLQRDEPLAVWGRAEPGLRVRVSLGPGEAVAESSPDGAFHVWLPAMPAGGPYVLEAVYDGEKASTRSEDILIGEVWIASGQSNMAFSLSQCGGEGDRSIAEADDTELRHFRVENTCALNARAEVAGEWMSASPTAAAGFSATGYHFAKFLRERLNVPVGVVVAAWGGTMIESWMSRPALMAHQGTSSWTSAIETDSHSPSRWARMAEANAEGLISILPSDPGNTGLAMGWADHSFDDSAWATMDLPRRWQDCGHDFSGVFWFRKEVTLPPEWVGHELRLHMGGVDKQDIAFANGIEIGRTGAGLDASFWNAPREYVIPGDAVASTSLQLAIRVYSFSGHGAIAGPLLIGLDGVEPIDLAGPWRYEVEHNFGKVLLAHAPGHLCPNTPHILFDNLIAPMVPFAARGTIWYQGEQNLGQPEAYRDLLRALIADWQYHWGKPAWPFLVVQLPLMNAPSPYEPDSAWAALREAQRAAVSATPGAGLAVTIDLGDVTDIHPHHKKEVGARLARVALAEVYECAPAGGGPLPTAIERLPNGLRVSFRRVGEGLRSSDGLSPQGFYVAGEGEPFAPAPASLEHNAVLLTVVGHMMGVRYAWADNPYPASLTDSEGVPAGTFELTL